MKNIQIYYDWSPEDSRDNPEIRIVTIDTKLSEKPFWIKRRYSLSEDLEEIVVRSKYLDGGEGEVSKIQESFTLPPSQEIKPWIESNHKADLQEEFRETFDIDISEEG